MNLNFLKAFPDLFSADKDEPITYRPDMNTYYTIEPLLQKEENIYFMESSIDLEDNIWDIFKLDKKTVSLFEVH